MNHISYLTDLGACHEAVEWATQYPDLGAAWQACERGDHMLWLAGRLAGPPMSASRRPLALAAGRCAALVLPYTDDAAVHNAVALTLRFGAGEEVSIEELQRAATATYAAAARRGAILRQCAEIVRVVYPDPPEVTT